MASQDFLRTSAGAGAGCNYRYQMWRVELTTPWRRFHPGVRTEWEAAADGGAEVAAQAMSTFVAAVDTIHCCGFAFDTPVQHPNPRAQAAADAHQPLPAGGSSCAAAPSAALKRPAEAAAGPGCGGCASPPEDTYPNKRPREDPTQGDGWPFAANVKPSFITVAPGDDRPGEPHIAERPQGEVILQ